MLIELLFNGLGFIFDMIISLFSSLPTIPIQITDTIDYFFNFLGNSVPLVSFFFPLQYAAILLAFSLVIETCYWSYSFIIWVLRKIPVIGIS